MRIDIIDLDHFYAEALAKRLQGALPGVEIHCVDTPEKLASIPIVSDEEEIEPILEIFTQEQFPHYKPEADHLVLRDERLVDQGQAAEGLRRLGPVSEIIAAVCAYEEAHAKRTKLKPVTSYFAWQWSEAIRNRIGQNIHQGSRSGIQALVVELGPAVLFPEAAHDSSLDFLVDLSLRKIGKENCGQYFEPWPPYPETLRLFLPSRSDDWLLSPDSLVMEAITLIGEWASEHYGTHWRLYVLACFLPFRLCRPLAALSEEVEVIPPAGSGSRRLWQTEKEALAGLVPVGGRFGERSPGGAKDG